MLIIYQKIFVLLAGTVSDGFHNHPPLLTVLPIENVAHGLGHAPLPVDVELVQGVVHGVGQAHDTWKNISVKRENIFQFLTENFNFH